MKLENQILKRPEDTSGQGRLEIALPVSNGEKSQAGKKARTKGQRLDLAWQQGFWKRIHLLCLKCGRDCKQSAQVKIITCPQFSALEEIIEAKL